MPVCKGCWSGVAPIGAERQVQRQAPLLSLSLLLREQRAVAVACASACLLPDVRGGYP